MSKHFEALRNEKLMMMEERGNEMKELRSMFQTLKEDKEKEKKYSQWGQMPIAEDRIDSEKWKIIDSFMNVPQKV